MLLAARYRQVPYAAAITIVIAIPIPIAKRKTKCREKLKQLLANADATRILYVFEVVLAF